MICLFAINQNSKWADSNYRLQMPNFTRTCTITLTMTSLSLNCSKMVDLHITTHSGYKVKFERGIISIWVAGVVEAREIS